MAIVENKELKIMKSKRNPIFDQELIIFVNIIYKLRKNFVGVVWLDL